MNFIPKVLRQLFFFLSVYVQRASGIAFYYLLSETETGFRFVVDCCVWEPPDETIGSIQHIDWRV